MKPTKIPEAWTASVRQAALDKTRPRPTKPEPPFSWLTDSELLFIAESLAGRGRAGRAVAAWAALCAVANQKRSTRFSVTRSALERLSGLSVRVIVGTLKDLERIGMLERIGTPSVRGQGYSLRSPVR